MQNPFLQRSPATVAEVVLFPLRLAWPIIHLYELTNPPSNASNIELSSAADYDQGQGSLRVRTAVPTTL